MNRKEYNRYHLENRLLFRVHAAQEEIKRRQRQRGERDSSSLDVTELRDSNSSDVHRDANESGDECNWETASEDSDGDDDFVDAEDDRRHDVSVTQSAELHVTPVKDDIVNQTSALCSNGVVAKSENTPMPKSCTPSSANITQSVNDAAQTGTSDTNVIQSGNCDDQSGTEVRQSCKGVK